MDTERTEEYLEAIYKEQSKGESASTSFLARDLGVSQPAVTDMLKNLESKGLIDYKSSQGATLTDTGVEKGAWSHKTASSVGEISHRYSWYEMG